MSSEFKFLCLEWCTTLPELNHTLRSPVFLQQGRECQFKFAFEVEHLIISNYNMYVELKSGYLKWKPCDVKLRVGFKSEKDFSLGEKTFTVSEKGTKKIWFISEGDLQSKLPSDHMNDHWIKFRFCFEDVEKDIPKSRKKLEDKCLQTASYLNTDVPVESSAQDLSKLLDTGENHDAEIKCGDHSIKIHKIILSARSEVFKAMLGSDMLEGRTGVVEIQDMDVNYIQDFVRYLYTGAMPELTFEKAKLLYEAGDKYAVRSLMLRCSEFLQDNLSSENAFECFELADAHSDDKLKNSFITFCLEKRIYLQEEVWSPFCENNPKVALEIYRLSHRNDL